MIWDDLIERIYAIIDADTVLKGLYGDAMRMAGTAEHSIPSLEWTLITDRESELWAPHVIQFDQWSFNLEDVVTSERRLRALFHQDLPVLLGGDLLVWAEYQDGTVLAAPDRNGFAGRAVRFRFTPLRERYAGLAAG